MSIRPRRRKNHGGTVSRNPLGVLGFEFPLKMFGFKKFAESNGLNKIRRTDLLFLWPPQLGGLKRPVPFHPLLIFNISPNNYSIITVDLNDGITKKLII